MAKSFYSADILIPKHTVSKTKWSVVACDQFTSEPEYWESLDKEVGLSPSSLRLILPEIYLSESEKRIPEINKEMQNYIDNGVFENLKNTYIYVERTLSGGKVRKGIVGAIDLEDYSYEKGVQSKIRATEETVLERIPPRVKIRENALLEMPHIMLLIDDPALKVIEPLCKCKSSMEPIYEFELMKNGGYIKGFKLIKGARRKFLRAIRKMSSKSAFYKKYKIKNSAPLIFAVGDGNHSLASAKACWENVKKTLSSRELKNHPARYALCEIVNLHDESLEFEPIHRVIFNVNPDDVISELLNFYPSAKSGKSFTCVYNNKRKQIVVSDDRNNITTGTVQMFIDDYLKKHPEAHVDYIHGEDVVERLCKQTDTIGFLLPSMDKSELFRTVILDGALPRKTFSMGEANDKRYYFEARKIK